MFGLEFSAAAAVNAILGGLVGAAATVGTAWWAARRATVRYWAIFEALEIALNQLLKHEGRSFEWIHADDVEDDRAHARHGEVEPVVGVRIMDWHPPDSVDIDAGPGIVSADD